LIFVATSGVGQRLGRDTRVVAGRGAQAQPFGDDACDVGGEIGAEEEVGHALGDAAVEQTGGSGHDHQHRDRCGARRFAEDGDVVRIAAESGDVVVHPLKRSDLVEQSPVGAFAPAISMKPSPATR